MPERFDAEMDETGIIRVGDYQRHLITNSHSGDKIEFTISIPNRDDGAVIKGTYFKKKQKFAVKVDYDVRYIDSGLIWGKCEEASTTQAVSLSSASNETKRPWLGVFIQSITPEIANELGLENENGALVASVHDGGPAEEAAFKLAMFDWF